ncbi:MAG: hypothetical protein U1D35_04875 [Paracoccaceae bacterium]|nr:hypothetical protein [Paracoccaceae bacterium]
MNRILASLATVAFASAALAQDFSVNSEAKSWNLYAETPARFEARVVDVLCDLTGDCPADCGEGRRQLGLLRKADGVMVLPAKNAAQVFAGAANELQPFCGKAVEVDGLLLDDPDIGAKNIYQIQKIRAVGAPEWIPANRWVKDWEARTPAAAGKGPWFRRDPRIAARIAADGYFGLGLETDSQVIADLFK